MWPSHGQRRHDQGAHEPGAGVRRAGQHVSAGAASGGARAVLPLPAVLLQGDEAGQARRAKGRRQFRAGREGAQADQGALRHGRGVHGHAASPES